jgi:hypothetical protein
MIPFLMDNYLFTCIIFEAFMFTYLYVYRRYEHNYFDVQILGLIGSLVWPITSVILALCLIFVIAVIVMWLMLKAITAILDKVLRRPKHTRTDNRTW